MEDKEPLISIATELELRNTDSVPGELRKKIESRISDLIANDLNRLTLLLYRLDVNEKKLAAALEQNRGSDAAIIITDLVIERQLQKAITRKQDHGFRRDENIPDDEKW
jgi:hypothetical protein